MSIYRARGLKVTPQRLAVFEALDGHMGHPTAEMVHELVRAELPTVSLRTVYSILHELSDMGEIGEIELGTGATRFDPNTDPHHHRVCDRCGMVLDVPVFFPHVRLPDALAEGFVSTGAEIVFRGRCVECLSTDDEQHPDRDRVNSGAGSARSGAVNEVPSIEVPSQGDAVHG